VIGGYEIRNRSQGDQVQELRDIDRRCMPAPCAG